MREYLEFVDDVLYDFNGELGPEDIYHMTYKEIGYMRDHRKKHHPRQAESLASLLTEPPGSTSGGKAQDTSLATHPAHRPPGKPAI